jgi:hypothetical protein
VLCSAHDDPSGVLSHLPFGFGFGICRVIFGMLIALPITLVYYILLGL